MENKIINHLNKFDLDIRKSGNARFMDQKVTPDVLCIISDCILQFIGSDIEKEFTTKDIWESPYSNENIQDIFNKPSVLIEETKSEYDKFFAQPLKMLEYSQVLKCEKRGKKNIFKIQNIELLNYLSLREKNSLTFLIIYLEKVLSDSGIWNIFDNFFKINTKENFDLLKDKYENFIIENTPINGKVEVRRIFTKIINPLCYKRKLHGTEKGFFSRDIIGYESLMYNRKNWRDIAKLKGESRQDWENRAKKRVESTYKYNMEKAKRLIRLRHNDISEVNDEYSNGQATQVHHIFPRSEYPTIDSYLENLILLTATQHSTKAHPSNNTRKINKEYQLICLLSKIKSIQDSININDGFYSKDDFIFVLNEGIKNIFDSNKNLSELSIEITEQYNII